MRVQHRVACLLAPLLAGLGSAAFAAAEERLLAELSPGFREPQARCEWNAGHFESIERRLSLYREELAAVHVAIDGFKVGDSASGAVQLLAFESRHNGPASVTILLDQQRANAHDRLRPGRRIEISFSDRSGGTHPLFCGFAAIVRPDAATKRTVVVALIPRIGAELQQSATFLDQSCVDILVQLAEDTGLPIDVYAQHERATLANTVRKAEAAWPFMQRIARQCRMDLVLKSDGRLALTESDFALPPTPVARTWTQMSWVDIAAQIAANQGRELDARLTGSHAPTTLRQTVDDEAFLLEVSVAARASAWYLPGKLVLAEDGVWSQLPPAALLPPGAGERLLKRVVVTGSTATQRSFTRRVTDARLQSRDPERTPAVETVLRLGRAMPAATLPSIPLADAATIANAFDGALNRLGAQAPDTAERRFLRDLARVYRPSLLHLFRLKADGARTLDAIGR